MTQEYPHGICIRCGKPLRPEELYYYEYRCEECESEELERWQAWRSGAPDEELDALFDEEWSAS